MLSRLNNDQLQTLLRALESAPPPLPGAVGHGGISNYLLSQGISAAIANEIERALSADRFGLPTLKSATAFALSRKLATIQVLCIAASILAGFLLIASTLFLHRSSLWIGIFMVLSIVTAAKYSREKQRVKGRQIDFQTVEQSTPKSFNPASEDIY